MFKQVLLGQLSLNWRNAFHASLTLLCCGHQCDSVPKALKNIGMIVSLGILFILGTIDTYNNAEAVKACVSDVLSEWGVSKNGTYNEPLSSAAAGFSAPSYFANNAWLALVVLLSTWGVVAGKLISGPHGTTHIQKKKDEDNGTETSPTEPCINVQPNNRTLFASRQHSQELTSLFSNTDKMYNYGTSLNNKAEYDLFVLINDIQERSITSRFCCC